MAHRAAHRRKKGPPSFRQTGRTHRQVNRKERPPPPLASHQGPPTGKAQSKRGRFFSCCGLLQQLVMLCGKLVGPFRQDVILTDQMPKSDSSLTARSLFCANVPAHISAAHFDRRRDGKKGVGLLREIGQRADLAVRAKGARTSARKPTPTEGGVPS